MDRLPGTLEELSARVQTLEQRVYLLEHASIASTPEAAADSAAILAAQAGDGISFAQTGGLFSVLGKAMLGIAGAYVLRAVAESTSLPRLAVAAIAIAYALTWLVWAVRVKAETWVASAIYAGASAVILAPMLWELTLSFKVLTPSASAAILAAFVLAASALAWKRDLAPVLWVANVTAAVAALALSIASRQLAPFIAAILLMVLICEVSAGLKHAVSLRPFVAAAADLAIWALIFIYSGPQTARVEYPPLGTAAVLAPGCVLFFIYAAGIVLRTTLVGENITIFETLQAIIAFLLAASSVLYFEPRFGAIGLGVACLLLSAACCALDFAAFQRVGAGRNFQVFAAWSAALLFVGSVLCLPPLTLAFCLGLAAVASTFLGIRLNSITLQIHGLLILLAAAGASGLIGYAFHALVGTLPTPLTAAVCVVSICVLACYAANKPSLAENWVRQSLRLILAALTICALAALIVQGLLFLASLRVAPGAHHVAFIRTFTICAIALAAAVAGSHWHRAELTRIAFATLALVAAKLLLEDLRQGHLEFIAASIFLFAITLIAVPKLAHMSRKM
jgi:hypothetical protein